MAGERIRGSEIVAQRFTEKDLVGLFDLEHEGVELIEAFPIGIPVPDGGWGTWHVRPGALSGLIAALLQHRHVPGFWVFPKGIPRPDWFEVRFEAGSARQR